MRAALCHHYDVIIHVTIYVNFTGYLPVHLRVHLKLCYVVRNFVVGTTWPQHRPRTQVYTLYSTAVYLRR